MEDTQNIKAVLCDIREQIATVTINRPRVLNALNEEVFTGLRDLFTMLAKDDAVRVILITGAGEKAFAAGADIGELTTTTRVSGRTLSRRGSNIFRKIETCGKPVIALINGFALGGGCELAMSCTMRIASEAAKLGQPEIKLGLIPGYGGTQRLPRLVGQSAALKLILTGEMITAQEALRLGLVDEIVAADRLLERGNELARSIIAMAPLAVSGCLEAVYKGAGRSLDDALNIETGIFGRLCGTSDKAEGTKAFLEKRPAVWTGR